VATIKLPKYQQHRHYNWRHSSGHKRLPKF